MLHDPIADLLTRIRNAKHAKHRFVDFRPSKMKVEIVKVLQSQGFIDRYLVDEEQFSIPFTGIKELVILISTMHLDNGSVPFTFQNTISGILYPASEYFALIASRFVWLQSA